MKSIEQVVKRTDIEPIRILQFGDGNFIRGFFDWAIHQMNLKANFHTGIVSVAATPRGITAKQLQQQDGLFTVQQRGIVDGESYDYSEVVQSIQSIINPYEQWTTFLEYAKSHELRWITSNTTEAGIVYENISFANECPKTYPAKLVRFLYARFEHFQGDQTKGLTILPLELIEDNGEKLLAICKQHIHDWQLGEEFEHWINKACTFCNTLVDRIVPGFPEKPEQTFEQLNYTDQLLTVCEPYFLFVIEGADEVTQSWPVEMAALPIRFESIKLYRERKVSILNGSHSILGACGPYFGCHTVRDAIHHPTIYQLVKHVMGEFIGQYPTNQQQALMQYQRDIINRFKNPYLVHHLSDIRLNTLSKWQTRIVPRVIESYESPPNTILSLAIGLFTMNPLSSELRDTKHNIKVLRTFHEKISISNGEQAIQQIFTETFNIPESIQEKINPLIINHFKHLQKEGPQQYLKNWEEQLNETNSMQ